MKPKSDNYSQEYSEEKFWDKIKKNALNAPFSVYELHLGSWKKNVEENRFLTYKEIPHFDREKAKVSIDQIYNAEKVQAVLDAATLDYKNNFLL